MKKKAAINRTAAKYMCIIVFLVLFIFFAVATEGKIIQKLTLRSILNQSVNTLIGGLGMIFVVTVGGTDMSLGSLVAFSAVMSFMATEALGLAGWAQVAVMFVICIIIGSLSGSFIGFLNTKFKVPSFMASLAMLIALRGAVSWVLGANYFLATPQIRVLDGWGVKIPALVVMVAVVWFLFEYTPFGYYCKAIGENENAIKFAGVNTNKIKRLAFLMSGLMAGLATMFTVARVGGAENTLAAGYEMKVMMALFVAGVPVSGGTGAKIFKLIVGALTVNMLESGLTLLGLTGANVQLVRGIVLLVMIVISTAVMRSADGTLVLRKRAVKESKA